jgi:mitogen-activated protein kinase 1/3
VIGIFDSDYNATHIMREIRLLRLLQGHNNIIKLKHVMRPPDAKNFNNLNIVTEYCSQNLMNIIKFNEDKLSNDHIRYFLYEIMKGVHFLHSRGIIHRDIKPLNILVNSKWEVKITDFGQSNVQTQQINKDYAMTKVSITTRFYRAPELFLNYSQAYTSAIDMWSVGCLLAELFNKEIFVQGSTEKHLLDFLV